MTMGWRPWWVMVAGIIVLIAIMVGGNIARGLGIIP